jgi:penicillin V acylase-like amidase (Ntn superfamily)
MNKNGVSISINVSGNAQTTHQKSPDDFDTANHDKINLNSFALVRMILDYAQNLDDALELMSNFYLNDLSFESAEPIHYQISDKSGNSAIVEFEEGYVMPSIIMTGDIVAAADTEFNYSITGTNKNFLINENFNLNNLYGEMETEGFDT